MADLNETSSFFAAIEAGNVGDVEKHLRKRLELKDALQNGLSPAAVALKTQPLSLEMYKILHQRGCSPTEAEWSEIDLMTNQKFEVNEIHIECARNIGHALLAKSKQLFEAPNKKQLEYCGLLIKAFKHLESIALIKPILELVAADAKLQIFLDFEHDGLNCADPRLLASTKGLASSITSRITIAAKKLLNDGDRKKFYGTLAHELCHHAMFLLYNNNSKPYRSDDVEREREFTGIIEKYRDAASEPTCELVIANAFKCEVDKELIVRVPQLLAMYNEKEPLGIESKFSDLFKFYKEKTFKDLEVEIPLLEGKNQVKFINESFLVLRKLKDFSVQFTLEGLQALKVNLKVRGDLKIISSNCVKLTMKLIYENFKNDAKLCSSMIFAGLSDLNLPDFRQQVSKLMESKFEPTLIVSCDGKTEREVSELAKKFAMDKAGKGIFFVVNETKKLEKTTGDEENCTHLMEHLGTSTREMLLRREMNLQGFRVKLEEIVNKNWAKLRAIPLNDLMAGREVKVGEEIEFLSVKIHVERKFFAEDARWNWKTEPLTVNEVIELVENRKVFLLADQPGNGKSTEFKMLAKKLKEKFPSRWVAYIDLKRFTKFFQENGKVSMNFDDVEEIATFLAEKVLNLESFEAEMFVEMFEGRVIILMDGVDEISPSYNEFVVKLMVGIDGNKIKNQLWIATRPHLAEELKRKLKTEAMKLTKFSDENRREFFKKFFENKSLKAQNVLFSIEKLFKELDELSRDGDSVSNPMLVEMIAELFDENSDFQFNNSFLFLIYNEFVEKLKLKLEYKGPEPLKDLINSDASFADIIKCHQKKALEIIFLGYNIYFHDKYLELNAAINLCFKNTLDVSSHQMTRIGLTFDDGTGKVHFTHRTYAEFFVAQFFVEKMFGQETHLENENEVKPWWHVMKMFGQKKQSDEEMEVVVAFWWEALETNSNLNVVKKFLDDGFGIMTKNEKKTTKTFLEIIRRDIGNHKNILMLLAEDGCLNLIKFVSYEVVEDKKKLQAMWLCADHYESVLSAAAGHQPIKFVKKLWNLAKIIFTESQIKELLLQKNSRRSLLSSAIGNKKDEKPYEFFVQIIRKIFNGNELELMTSPKYLFTEFSGNPERWFDRCKKNFTAIEFQRFLRSTDEYGHTLLHQLCYHNYINFVQTVLDSFVDNFELSETKELLRKTDKYDHKTALMIAGQNKNAKIFKTLWSFIESNFDVQEQNEMLLEGDVKEQNAFHWSTQNEKKENFEFVKKFYEKKFGIEKIKEILAKVNEDGKNIMRFAIMKNGNEETIEALWKFMQKLFDDESLKKMLAKRSNFVWTDEWGYEWKGYPTLEVFETFIARTCNDNESNETFLIWLIVAEFYNIEFVEKLASIVDQKREFAASFYQKLFKFKDDNNKSILQIARKNRRDSEVFNFFISKSKNVKNR